MQCIYATEKVSFKVGKYWKALPNEVAVDK